MVSVSEFYIDQLVSLCHQHNFDGYFLNIESPLYSDMISSLVEFLRVLRTRLHECNPPKQLLLYDSITNTGDVRYQNGLSSSNKLFFDVCDGLFVNYWWTPERLKETASLACRRYFRLEGPHWYVDAEMSIWVLISLVEIPMEEEAWIPM